MNEIISNYIIPLGTSILGILIGYIFRLFWDRKLQKDMKLDELIINNHINNLKEKLDIYWTIYFKLLVCLSAKIQIKKINSNENIDLTNMITMENEIIIKNLDDINNIITQNIQIMDIDDNLLDLILRMISHTMAYKCLRQLNINKKPSDYGYSFPDDFTQEITKRTLNFQARYEKYLGNKYDNSKLKGNKYLNLSLNLSENSKINEEFKFRLNSINHLTNSINDTETDSSFVINPDDIDLKDIFIGVYQDKEPKSNELETRININEKQEN